MAQTKTEVGNFFVRHVGKVCFTMSMTPPKISLLLNVLRWTHLTRSEFTLLPTDYKEDETKGNLFFSSRNTV